MTRTLIDAPLFFLWAASIVVRFALPGLALLAFVLAAR